MPYHLIGDVHGCAATLAKLLDRLGYLNSNGTYRHETHTAIFLGDFIDRGPFQRQVIGIVRPMIDTGAALAVMGNHEFNAIAYHTPAEAENTWLRAHSEKHSKQHAAFLRAYERDDEARAEVIEWFKQLPLWLDLGSLRVVHACWDDKLVQRISTFQNGSALLSDALLRAASRPGTWQFDALETLLKGKEIKLPAGQSFADKDKNIRHNIRVRWWDDNASTFRKAYIGPESARTHIPDDQIEGDHLVTYTAKAPPVFIGHYWLEGEPEPIATNIACVDYSVAKPGGKLVAYCWDGEQVLNKAGFVSVDRLEPDR